jgi:uncharacterized lipoprotein YmbA
MRTFLSRALVLTVAALAGCSTSPTASFYTLGAVTAPGDAYTVRPVIVVVTSVTVPDLVDRPQFVVRVSDNQVKLDEFARWADPVKSQVPRVIAANLAVLLPGARVSVYPQDTDAGTPYRVKIELQRFDGAPGEGATVEALWSVSPPTGRAPMSGHTAVRVPVTGPGYEALVAAYSGGLGVVSHDIATAILGGLSK